jgi:hypothetical protein
MCYAKKYYNVLVSGDDSVIAAIESPSIRHHVFEALTILSKYCGLYVRLKEIISKYQLHWGNAAQDNFRYFTNYLYGSGNFEEMIAWLKHTLSKLPVGIGSVLLYNTLTGLRFHEGLLSIKLIQTDFDNYANEELGVLENFRYPQFTSKKTKKSYLTAYDDSIIQVALNSRVFHSWDHFRKTVYRYDGINSVHSKYCRAIFATFLRQYGGIEQEIISLYQGRAPSTIFQAHYLKTNIKEDRRRILEAVHKLSKQIQS